MSELTILSVASDAIGYGRMGVNLISHLRKQGVEVFDRFDSPDGDSAYSPAQAALNSGRRQKLTNVVVWCSVPGHARGWWEGQHSACMTMYETDFLPPAFKEALHNFDTLIVPSEQNLDLFGRHHDNVHLVQLGIDPDVWQYRERTMPEQEFRFLIGGSGTRKGTDLAFRAFNKVFKTWPANGPVPKLIMKSPKPEDFYGDRVERVGGRISAEAEVALYASAHCYIQRSRGEGFGLQPLQAMAQGCPTILTDAHGHKAFSHLGMGLSTTMADAAYFVHGPSGQWWEPDFDELCEYMAEVYLNYDPAVKWAKAASGIVHDNFTWDISARQFLDVFGDELDKPYSGSGVWREPNFKRYRTITNADFSADIAGVHYRFLRGQEYWELADVKRILWEGGHLDPRCCVGDDTGLLEQQLSNMPAYSARHSICPMCNRPLDNGDSTLADQLFARLEAQR